MKNSTLLGLGALGVAAFLYFKNASAEESRNVSPISATFPEMFPQSSAIMAASTTSAPIKYQQAVETFLRQPVNTVESIRSGVEVINAALTEGVQLPRLSGTISKISANTGIARLADGTIKQISVNQPARDNQGRTNFDRIIAKNKALSSSKKK